jgi:putative transcriptional regulator
MSESDDDIEDEVVGESLEGRLLIAMPGMGDPRFDRTLIYLCAHSEDGAMGLVVNKTADNLTFDELLAQLKIPLAPNLNTIRVHYGGPVEMGRGFVLHSTDYFAAESTLPIDERIGLTETLDVLRAIAAGTGPRLAMLALGYSGWGPGQLEREIQTNGWLNCAADEQLIFDPDLDSKYGQALARIGIDPGMLSSDAGHA